MKRTWKLLIPDWSSLDQLWENPNPFCLWPVGHEPLIAHWMDEAVAQEVDCIEIYTADRPAEIRAFLSNGDYWSRELSIIPIAHDDLAPEDAIPVVGLPRHNKLSNQLGESRGALLQHWLTLNHQWLEGLDDYSLKIEVQREPGGWIGPHTRIHPSAKLKPPYWIKGKCDIGAGAQIGPFASIAHNVIVDANATITESFVLPNTLVGRNTSLDRVVVDGNLLLDSKRGSRVTITDAFILSDISGRLKKASLFERFCALTLFTLLSPIAALTRVDWSELEAHDGRGGALRLKTGRQGWIILRRWHWLKEVAKGRMRLIGILPRPMDWDIETGQDMKRKLTSTLPGVFSLSDAHDCHCPSDPMEWIHASYQAMHSEREIKSLLRPKIWKIAFKSAL